MMKVKCVKKYGFMRSGCIYSLDDKRKFTKEALKAGAIEPVALVESTASDDTNKATTKKGSK
jgi:hypothetical protein